MITQDTCEKNSAIMDGPYIYDVNFYQKTCKRGHEPFFYKFPDSTKFFFINFLKRIGVYVNYHSIDDTKSTIQWISIKFKISFTILDNYNSLSTYNIIATRPLRGITPQINPTIIPKTCLDQ